MGYYPLNEGTGTIAHDMSGNGHDGTLYNGVTWISPGYLGGGVNDNGTADSRIQLGTWDPAAGTGQLSLTMWIRWSGEHRHLPGPARQEKHLARHDGVPVPGPAGK